MTTNSSRVPPIPERLKDFKAFLYMCWQFLNIPEPTWVQYDIADYLQHGPRRKVIEAFRGVGKSWITSAYVAWMLRLDPQLNFLVVSASKSRADDFSTFTLRLINEMPVLQCLYPREDQRQSKVAFDVRFAEPDHAPSVKSVGIFGQLTGGRADIIIADDIEVPNNALTQAMRDKLSEAVKEFDSILKPKGRITYLGTPQTEQSLYNALPERGYDIRVWPARYPDEKLIMAYGDRLAPKIAERLEKKPELVKQPTDPKRFNEIELQEREASLGRSTFSLQFMLDTSLSDADRYPLKLRDLVVMSLNPDMAPQKVSWGADPDLIVSDLPNVGFNGDKFYRPFWVQKEDMLPYQASVMFIDPSGRGKDETGYSVVKMLNGYLWCTACGGFVGGYEDETLEALAKIAKQHKVNWIRIEPNFGDGMFTKLFQPVLGRIYPCTVEDDKRSVGQKELRIIDTLEPVMNQHRLIIDRAVIEKDYESTKHLPPEQALKYQLFYQMTRLTKERGCLKHDDRIEALAGAVAYWVEQMAQDVERRIEERKEQVILDELAAFVGHAKSDVTLFVVGLRDNKTSQTVFGDHIFHNR